jgi:hypothetical protein
MNRKPILLLALLALAALILSAAASGSPNRKIWCVGNLCVADDGGISPTKLPRHGKAPIAAVLNGEVTTKDGTHPPALQSLDLEIDKTIGVDAVGLPTCRIGQLQSRDTATAKKACGDAIVGSGDAEVEVAFPEQKPFRSTGPMVLFNAGVKGKTTTVLLHAYVDVPAPTAIVVKATIARIHHGRFGLEIEADIPRIAGGSGSVTEFELKVGRKYAYKGRRKSFLTASCPTGTWLTRGHARFSDDTELSILHPFSCTPKG